jgi:hypothetical protein
MLLSMLLNCVAVVPSETLVLLVGWAEGGGLDLPLAGALVATSAAPVGNGLTGLSIFTVILSNLICWYLIGLYSLSVKNRETLG